MENVAVTELLACPSPGGADSIAFGQDETEHSAAHGGPGPAHGIRARLMAWA